MINITKIDPLNMARELEGKCEKCGHMTKIICYFDVDENGNPVDLEDLCNFSCIKCGGNL